jgi:signal transduction histidine kinase/DNA-binding response OmpR family regulator
MRMPTGWDGMETTARLLQADKDLQIVICTAYSDHSWSEMTRRLGAPDRMVILKKPFDVIEILQLSNALTEKWRLGREAEQHVQNLDGLVQLRTRELQAANDELSQDIAERKKAEEALRESEQRLSEIIDFLPDATFAVDRHGKVIAWNRAMEEFSGCQAGEMLGKSDYAYALPFYGTRRPLLIDMVITPDKAAAGYYTLFKTKGDILVGEMEARVQGRKRLLWGKASRLFNRKGEVAGAIETVRDVSEQKELESQLRQAQKMEAFGQLAAGVAHDFNNILTVILGNASTLQAHAMADADRIAAASEICLASHRAANLTRQLLTFSQRQVFQPKVIDLNCIVANMTKMLLRLIGEHIHLEARYGSAAAWVHADPAMIELILVNLAVNSRDAMPEGGRLVLETGNATFGPAQAAARPKRQAGSFAHLSVADTGTGIAPENLPHIFEPFFTTKEPGKGTGLGLATVFGIVEQHRGWIEIESQLNAGTAFHIYLPLSPLPTPAAARPAAASPSPGGNETILIVEDEAALRRLSRLILERKGYRVLEAESGAAAWLLWQQQRANIDMLITDMVMPGGIGGRELAAKTLAEKPALKVIYCSGYTDDMLGPDSVLRVNGNFLEKPFSPDELLRRVRAQFDGSH